MLCFRCGFYNQERDDTIWFCDKCHAKLSIKEEPFQLSSKKNRPDRLEKILTTADKFLKGKCTSEEFLQFLNKQLESMKKFEKALNIMDIPEELIEEFAPQISVSLKGVKLYNKAIKTLQSALTKSHEEMNKLISEGIEIARKGNIEINASFKMSEDKLRQIREETPRYEDGDQCDF